VLATRRDRQERIFLIGSFSPWPIRPKVDVGYQSPITYVFKTGRKQCSTILPYDRSGLFSQSSPQSFKPERHCNGIESVLMTTAYFGFRFERILWGNFGRRFEGRFFYTGIRNTYRKGMNSCVVWVILKSFNRIIACIAFSKENRVMKKFRQLNPYSSKTSSCFLTILQIQEANILNIASLLLFTKIHRDKRKNVSKAGFLSQLLCFSN
jgi:hypothetical protein